MSNNDKRCISGSFLILMRVVMTAVSGFIFFQEEKFIDHSISVTAQISEVISIPRKQPPALSFAADRSLLG